MDPITRDMRVVSDTPDTVVNTPVGRAVYERLELTPACDTCGVPAGFCYGDGWHYTDVPRRAS